MNIRPFVVAMWMLVSTGVEAGTSPTRERYPARLFCSRDLSEFPFPVRPSPLTSPEGLVEGALRPGLTRVQRDVCRCLPRRRRHHPPVISAWLLIQPNAGAVTVEYRLQRPWSRPMTGMVECLGEPTLTIQPMSYVSDMITEDGRVEEVLRYPLIVELGERKADGRPVGLRRSIK